MYSAVALCAAAGAWAASGTWGGCGRLLTARLLAVLWTKAVREERWMALQHPDDAACRQPFNTQRSSCATSSKAVMLASHMAAIQANRFQSGGKGSPALGAVIWGHPSQRGLIAKRSVLSTGG